jgi:hypothetical protein
MRFVFLCARRREELFSLDYALLKFCMPLSQCSLSLPKTVASKYQNEVQWETRSRPIVTIAHAPYAFCVDFRIVQIVVSGFHSPLAIFEILIFVFSVADAQKDWFESCQNDGLFVVDQGFAQ